MFGKNALIDGDAVRYFCEYKIYFLFAAVYSTSVFKILSSRLKGERVRNLLADITPVIYLLIFGLSAVYLVTGGYNPFIYFNF